jgi:hypothetical protein
MCATFSFLALILSAGQLFGTTRCATLALSTRHNEVRSTISEATNANPPNNALIGSTNSSEADKREGVDIHMAHFSCRFWELGKSLHSGSCHIIRDEQVCDFKIERSK